MFLNVKSKLLESKISGTMSKCCISNIIFILMFLQGQQNHTSKYNDIKTLSLLSQLLSILYPYSIEVYQMSALAYFLSFGKSALAYLFAHQDFDSHNYKFIISYALCIIS